jgi:hypothetical protein
MQVSVVRRLMEVSPVERMRSGVGSKKLDKFRYASREASPGTKRRKRPLIGLSQKRIRVRWEPES